MAQTKRKRKTKHRGTAAGNVVARGRTSAPGSRSKTKQQVAQQRAQARQARASQPPTWNGAITRAGIAAAIFLVVMLIMKQPFAAAAFVTGLMFFVYIPMGYYTDRFLYNRRQARTAREAAVRKAERDKGE